MNFKISIFIILVSVIFSCTKPKNSVSSTAEPAKNPATSLIIDSTLSSINITSYFNNIPNNTYLNVFQELDLDNDNHRDLMLKLSQTWPENSVITKLTIETFNDNTYVLTSPFYYSSYSTNSSAAVTTKTVMPNTKLNAYRDTLKLNAEWRNGNFMMFEHTLTNTSMYQWWQRISGFWLKKGINFVGVKFNNHMGWIELNVIDSLTVRLDKVALQK